MEENKNVEIQQDEAQDTKAAEAVTQEAEDKPQTDETAQEAETDAAEKVQEEKAEETTEESAEEKAAKALAASEAKAAEYLDRWQRLMAEFDNYRKRSEKEKTDAYDFAVSNTVVELLPIIDNFERALKVESTDKALSAGVQMIYKQLLGMLEKLHVTPIEAEGKEFDPNLHNAIQHVEDETVGENIIVEELQKGYLYKEEKVIRHSLVKVAN